MKLTRLLLIDDDVNLLQQMREALSGKYTLFTAEDYPSAHHILATNTIDIAVCDIFIDASSNVPSISQIQHLSPKTRVFILTGNPMVEALIALINLRVDGILEKPCNASTLDSWIQAHLATQNSSLSVKNGPPDDLLSAERRSLRSGQDWIPLTKIEFKILKALIDAQGRILHRDQLLKEIWPGTKVSNHTLDTHLYNLKKKSPSLEECIQCIHGEGYLFETSLK